MYAFSKTVLVEEEATMGIGSRFATDVLHLSDPHLGFSDRCLFAPDQ